MMLNGGKTKHVPK